MNNMYAIFLIILKYIINILLELTCRVEIFEQGGKGIPQGDSTEKEGVEGTRRSGEGH